MILKMDKRKEDDTRSQLVEDTPSAGGYNKKL
jgi:hypothetical protein